MVDAWNLGSFGAFGLGQTESCSKLPMEGIGDSPVNSILTYLPQTVQSIRNGRENASDFWRVEDWKDGKSGLPNV